MIPSQAYVAISILVLAVIAVLVFSVSKDKRPKRITPLAGLAFAFVLAGIVFGESRPIGYSLMGVGVALAVIDMVRKLKRHS